MRGQICLPYAKNPEILNVNNNSVIICSNSATYFLKRIMLIRLVGT